MQYTVRVWNKDYLILKQTADMPTCMHMLGLMTQGVWTTADMVNAQTGEVIVKWENNTEYGVTTF